MTVSEKKVVTAEDAWGWNWSIWALFGSGPRWVIRCGACGADFFVRIRLSPRRENVREVCTHCGAVNELTGLNIGPRSDGD